MLTHRGSQRLELEDVVNKLSVVHVAGTKGKARVLRLLRPLRCPTDAPPPPQGSTCAFAESILRRCGHRTGLFTSPHLVDVRERIQIDGCVPSGHAGAHTPLTRRAPPAGP